jgi:hypothetical protein
MPTSTYVIHATCRYVVQNKKTKETESGQNRPTIAIDATTERAAIRKATAQQKKAISSVYWPCISFHLIPELVNVIEHATPQQKKALRRLRDGKNVGNAGMLRRLVDKNWVEGSLKDGFLLTSRGKTEAG